MCSPMTSSVASSAVRSDRSEANGGTKPFLAESLFDQFKASKEGDLDALLADQIAAAMKEWYAGAAPPSSPLSACDLTRFRAISRGATHFTHWFQCVPRIHPSHLAFHGDIRLSIQRTVY